MSDKNDDSTPTVPEPPRGGDAAPSQLGRHHHALFAHSVLRDAVFATPPSLFGLVVGGEGEEILKRLWNLLGAEIAKGGGEGLPDDGLTCDRISIADRPAFIVTLPEPKGTTEAYYAVAVLAEPGLRRMFRKTVQPRFRYFTLEDSSNPFTDEENPTAFCEWTAERTHLNMGPGVPPTREAFLEAITGMLKTS